MELPLAYQGSQFLLAAGLGILYGLVYDLLRGLRRTLRFLTHILDLLFCLLFLAGNLLFALYVGQGEYRVFMLLATLLGAGLYFSTLSRLVFPFSRLFWQLIFLPFQKFWYILCKIFKKSRNFLKNVFSFEKKSVKIKGQQKRLLKKNKQEGSRRAPAQNFTDHNARSSGTAGGFHRDRSSAATEN